MKSLNKKHKTAVWFDMDGTLCKWRSVDFDTLYTKGFYENLEPQIEVIDALKELKRQNKRDVFVISSYLSDSEYALEEKKNWLEEHIPEVEAVFVPYGENKASFVPGGGHTTGFSC